MKIPPVGVGSSLERWMRFACRLGALLTFVAAGGAALAQNLAVTTLASGFNNPFGVAVDANGNAYVADTTNHVIKKITSTGTVTVLAGANATSGFSNTLPGSFNSPRGVTINSAGTVLYVSDTGNNAIRVVTLSGIGGTVSTITTLAGTGTAGALDSGASSTFNFPVGIALNPAGDTLYIADRNNNAIRSIVISVPTVATLAVTGGTFSSPTGVVVNSGATALFIADSGNHVIRRVGLPGLALTTYAGQVGVPGATNNATGTSASFNLPAGVALDGSDNLYVADFNNNSIRLVAAAGTNAVTTPAGGAGAGATNGTGSAAQFTGPNAVAVKSISGSLYVYVADTNNQLLRQASAPVGPTVGSPSNQSAAVGANGVTFTAAVTAGWPTPTVQWQRQANGAGAFTNLSNNANYSGVTTATLTVNGVTIGMQGDKFKLVATNSTASAESSVPATLTVSQAPTFPTPTVTFTATVGQAASFSNPASGSAPITYAITTGSSGIFTFNTSTGAITGTPTSTADSVTFTVTASNGVLPNATRAVTITAVITAPPIISVQPQPQTVAAAATTASFSVTASGTPAITSYQWERQIGGAGSFASVTDGLSGTTTFSGATTATLSIAGVTPAMNNDVFRVVIGNGTTPTTSSTALLTVQGTAPSITGSPSGATVDVGLNAQFTGSASGNPAPTVRWQRQAFNTVGFVDLSESFPYSGTTTGTLTVSSVSTGMNGDQFRLVATNLHGTATTSNAVLGINTLVPLFTVAPQNTTVNIAQNATFTGTAIGNPTPTLRWQKQPAGSFAGFFDLNDDGVYFGTSGNTLTVVSPGVAMNGDQFRLVATNINGVVPSSVAILTVSSTAPTITVNPSNVTANIGQSITFTGNATGVPSPTLRWQRQPSGTSGFVDLTDDGIFTGTTTTTLGIPVVTAGMTGDVYRLAANNVGGTVTSTAAILTVNLGTSITTFAGLATVAGSTDSVGVSARFNTPAAIVSDGAGNFYIADTGNSVIRRMTANGTVTTMAGLAGSRGSVDGIGSAARFNSPGGVAVDTIGNVYVADTFSHTIRVVSSSGVVSTLAGTPSSSGALDGVGAAARFFLPSGIALDPSGNIYVADTNNHAIRRITSGGTVTVFAGIMGVAGFVDSTNPLAARFNSPNAIVCDASGNLYVADSQNNVIRKITQLGVVTTLAGNISGIAGSADGTGGLASFNRPSGISVDSIGTVYVADTNSNTIRRITAAGETTTLAGQAGTSGSADGIGSGARFNRPFGVVMDSSSNLWVADTGNHTIRRSGTSTAPTITTQPLSRAAGIGQSTTFSVVATGAPSPTSYQWQRQAAFTFGFVNLSADTTYGGVNSNTLTVTNVNSAMQGDQFRVIVANGVNPAATSDAATLTIGVPPAFTSAPNATFKAGEANSFTITTDSTTAVTFSATNLPSWATLNSVSGVLSGSPVDNVGSPFLLVVSANNGVLATQAFMLTVLPPNLPPTITTQPAAVALDQGQTATFNVTVGGTPPFTYQWRRNGIAIAGATSASLALSNILGSSAASYSVVVTNAAGTVTSAGATLVVNTIPIITAQPRAQVAAIGGSATFDVAVSGGTSFTYQWRKNGVAIAGANAASLTVSNITAGDAGNFDVLVGNTIGTTTSSLAQLTTVTAATAPVIMAQPAARSSLAGTTASFSVAATGAPAPSYQWRKNGAAIAGATLPTLTLAGVQAGDAANYDVVVSNAAGSVTSSVAGLTVLSRSYAGVYFGNFGGGLGTFAIYVRDDNTGIFLGYLPGSIAPVLNLNLAIGNAGQFSFNQGAILGGSSNSDEPARAAALAPVTVTGSIGTDGGIAGSIVGGANATIAGTRSGDTGATQVAAGYYSAGAGTGAGTLYAIANANGQAFVIVLSGLNSDGGVGSVNGAGQVSVLTNRSIINATINASAGLISGNSTGAVTSTYTGGSDAAVALQRLVNISSRARVGTADAVAIAGFVISGTESKPVLIRAVGPTLGAAPFNVAGALAAPRLELFRGATSIGTNAGIGTNRTAIDAAGQRAGAFALGAAGTDAAILTTLAPGNYTAVVSSATTATGVALVEVYDLSAAAAGQKLLNISTRASAGTAENTLIAGFVVPPGSSKRVVIRGVGPGLTPFGVTGVLAQPTLTLLSGSTTVATNTNWTTSADAAAITSASAQVGAFGLANNDSAIIATLAPGNYTAQVSGPGTATGIALIEVYELP